MNDVADGIPPGKLILVGTGLRTPTLSVRRIDVSQPGRADWFPEPTLGELFTEVAARRGMARAITTVREQWSYIRLLDAAREITSRIATNPAFLPGGRIILLLPNSAEYVAAFYGVLLAGGVVVPLPPKIEQGMLEAIVESTEAPLIVTTGELRRARADMQGLPVEAIRVDSGLPPPKPTQPALNGSAGELAAILFTAGSSGAPKGVMLSHDNLIANARSIQEYLAITADERPLCVLPFHHAFGNSVLQSHLLAGAHLMIDGRTMFPETLVEALARHECTSLSGVPDLFRMLLERTSLGRTALPRLRAMAIAGGAIDRAAALEVARRIAPARLFVMYGQTEATARLAFIPPETLTELPEGAIGQGVPGVTLEVVDERGCPVIPDAVGELRAKGPNVMLGYWRDPEATSAKIRDGWLYTGDLATVDASRSIVLKGRRSALVKIAGHRVHPDDLEEFALRRLPVLQAVAVPYDVPNVGTRLALFLRSGDDSSDLTGSQAIARCRAELPVYLVPDFVQLVDAFPLNDALKIDRQRLSRLAEMEVKRRRTPA